MNALKADSIISVGNRVKGQDRWMDRQTTCGGKPSIKQLTEHFEKYEPTTVLFFETPFAKELFDVAARFGCKVVGIPMHEMDNADKLARCDRVICTCKESLRKTNHSDKREMLLPISSGLFPFMKREGHTFLVNIGYGGVNDRRQVKRTAEAFGRIKDDSARLIFKSQVPFPKEYEPDESEDPYADRPEIYEDNKKYIRDPRVTYNDENYDEPTRVYEQGDISILPIAYGGYERSITESMLCGLPTLTVDACPMNMYQSDRHFLLKPCKVYKLNKSWVYETYYNEVSVDDLRAKMEWLLTIDTGRYSDEARWWAEDNTWESGKYTDEWMDALTEW